MKHVREFVTNAVVGGLLVLLPIYLAVLLLLKGMKAVVSLVRPISALLPDWLPAENFLSVLLVLIACFFVGTAVRTRVWLRAIPQPDTATRRGEQRERVEAGARRDRGCSRACLRRRRAR